MFAILLGQLLGLVNKALIADAFPAAEVDAFFSANRVSETLFTLIAAGALGSAFLPTFTALLVRDERSSAWKLAAAKSPGGVMWGSKAWEYLWRCRGAMWRL